ncbi:MAG: hypothetical protein ABSD56_02225 [Bryobacteraceae bacterium]
MELPERIRVKISSEEAGYAAITPVVVREMRADELIEALLGVTGKDAARIGELLLRGTLVSGASRFRWQGFAAGREAIQAVLATFPDPEPERRFAPEGCVRAVLRGPGTRIEISREAASERRWLRRQRFWDVLMEVAAAAAPRYAGYSYSDRADRYAAQIPRAAAARLRESAGLLRYSSLQAQLQRARLEQVELLVERR